MQKKIYSIAIVVILVAVAFSAVYIYINNEKEDQSLSGTFTYSVSGIDYTTGNVYGGTWTITLKDGEITSTKDNITKTYYPTYFSPYHVPILPPLYGYVDSDQKTINSIESKNELLNGLSYQSQIFFDTNFGDKDVYVLYLSDGLPWFNYFTDTNGIVYEIDKYYGQFTEKFILTSYKLS